VLLDRRRVKFWQKWVFLFMAILMASFLVFGYSGVLQGCTNKVGLTQENPAEAKVKELTQQLQASPGNGPTMLSLAEAYQQRAGLQQTGSAKAESDYAQALALYDEFLALDPSQQGATKKEVKDNKTKALENQAQIYVIRGDLASVVKVYKRLTELRPTVAEYFLTLGTAAQQTGDTATALLAFTRYLELAPDAPEAATIKAWIKDQTQTASPTPAPTPSTTQSP
jgi:tetratricopeptide (TPR) repeat protein